MDAKILRTSVQPGLDGADLVTFTICDGSDLDTAPLAIRLEARLESAYLGSLREITVDALLRGRDLLDSELSRLLMSGDIRSDVKNVDT